MGPFIFVASSPGRLDMQLIHFLPITLLLVLTQPIAANLKHKMSPKKEYSITPPAGWKTIKNPRFHKVWIKNKTDDLSPQIYFTINRNIPEISVDRLKQEVLEMQKTISKTPDGKLIKYSRQREKDLLRIDFHISYSIYKKENKFKMLKIIRAYFTRGDQYLFMTLFKNKDAAYGNAVFKMTTTSFRINRDAPKETHPSRKYGILSNAINAIKRYWFILLPILIFSGITIWRGKKKTG